MIYVSADDASIPADPELQNMTSIKLQRYLDLSDLEIEFDCVISGFVITFEVYDLWLELSDLERTAVRQRENDRASSNSNPVGTST